MILIDSSCWLAFFLGDPAADIVEKHLSKTDSLLVPTVVLYEVYRKLVGRIGEEQAIFYVSQMEEGHVAPLNSDLAFQAADLSLKYKLGMADAIIYATTLASEATLVTMDNDFEGLAGCRVIH